MPYKKMTESANRNLLGKLLGRLMKHLQDGSEERRIKTKAGHIRYQEFYLAESKSIIDEIDQVLAAHYGFTDEELDFIISYDIRYRMGRDASEPED